MELKRTDKAVADMAALYEFLALGNRKRPRTVQALTAAPNSLLANHCFGKKPEEFERLKLAELSLSTKRCSTKFRNPGSSC